MRRPPWVLPNDVKAAKAAGVWPMRLRHPGWTTTDGQYDFVKTVKGRWRVLRTSKCVQPADFVKALNDAHPGGCVHLHALCLDLTYALT